MSKLLVNVLRNLSFLLENDLGNDMAPLLGKKLGGIMICTKE